MYALHNIDGLMQERRNSIANALELRLSCTNHGYDPCETGEQYSNQAQGWLSSWNWYLSNSLGSQLFIIYFCWPDDVVQNDQRSWKMLQQ